MTGEQTSLMRNIGAFFGHIARAVRMDVTKPPDELDEGDRERIEVRREIEEDDRGDMILRRTTIEEIEVKRGSRDPKSGA